MRWDDVLEAVMTAAETDATLVGIFGETYIRLSGTREYRVPSLEATVLSDDVAEVFEPTDLQWDIFAPSVQDLVDAERALRDLFDHERQVTIEGVRMWSFYLEGATLDGPTMDDATDVFAKAIRFRFAPVRERLTKGRS